MSIAKIDMDMNPDFKEIVDTMGELSRLKDKLQDLKDLYIKKYCPLRVGEVVNNESYSHTSKTMIIDNITLSVWSNREVEFVCFGSILRKDGTLSRHRGKVIRVFTIIGD